MLGARRVLLTDSHYNRGTEEVSLTNPGDTRVAAETDLQQLAKINLQRNWHVIPHNSSAVNTNGGYVTKVTVRPFQTFDSLPIKLRNKPSN